MNDTIVHVQDLCKFFRTFKRREGVLGAVKDLFVREQRLVKAVDHVSFDIARGEMVGYIGPNGAGKSTTIKMLTGILVPTEGEVQVNNFVPHRDRKHYTRSIGVVFGQRTQLWWDIAVIESFKLLRRIYDVSERDFDARMALFNDILRLNDFLHTPVRKLSLGERMRCDLAASLLHNPPLLFLDEPTIGLDVVAKESIREFLKTINPEFQTTILLTTHDLADIEELCRRIMIIDQGKILFDGSLEEIKRRLGKINQITLYLKDRSEQAKIAALNASLALLAQTLSAGAAKQMSANGLHLEQIDDLKCRIVYDRRLIPTEEILRQIVNSLEVRDILIEEESIEEIVKKIYTEGREAFVGERA
ncbi:MAG: ATP-binding cassette domain-containing protein [Acidobacteriia bacterium]|nr:ATP-binding cassette domain-containing protein [Terriglobia bacterium]